MTVVSDPHELAAGTPGATEHLALGDYLTQACEAGLWPPAPGDDSARVMARTALRMTVAATYPGLELFYLDRAETALWATQVAEDLIDEYSADGDLTYRELLDRWWSGPHHDRDLPRLGTTLVNSGAITGEQARTLLAAAWTDPEFPETGADAGDWLDAFASVGYLSDDDAAAPTAPLTLFRGAPPARAAGMAWTADRDIAQWFATRLDTAAGAGCVWATVAPPQTVLARFVRRSEDEYVLNPRHLRICVQLT